MLKRLICFFKEIFKDDIGVYCQEAKKPSAKWIIYWVIGSLLAIVIPIGLVYLEAWQFKWNVFALIWVEKANYFFRGAYYISCTCSNIGFLFLGYCNTDHINGDRQLLSLKKELRFWVVLGYSIFIVSFIVANILY